MKTIFLVLLIVAFTGLYSQNNDSSHVRKHEIDFGFTNLFNLFGGAAAASNNAGYINEDDYGPSGFGYFGAGYGGSGYGGYGGVTDWNYNFNPGYGVMYKYHLKPTQAMRIGVDYSSTNSSNSGIHSYSGTQSYPASVDSTNKYNLQSIKFVLKGGYQFQKKIKKILVFGGLDVFYYMNKSDYEIDPLGNPNYYEKGTSNVKGFGITPLGGVLFRIGEMFSISTETRFRLGSYTFTNNYTGDNASIGVFSGENSGKSFETKFSPIGLVSFNIHL